MQKLSIFEYSRSRDFLAAALTAKQEMNPRFSIRAWSKQLGHKNPAILARIIRGDRKLKPALASKLTQSLKLTGNDKRYFEILVLLENSKSIVEKEIHTDLLASLRPDRKFSNLTIDHFRMIADWYHLAILEMTLLKDFRSEPEWIARTLGSSVTTAMVTAAIDRMVRLELLDRSPSGELRRVPNSELHIGTHAPSEAIRKHHAQMIKKGIDAMETEAMDRRQVLGSTVTLTQKSFKRAQEILSRCHREILALSAPHGDGDQTFQLNTQIFSLTSVTKE